MGKRFAFDLPKAMQHAWDLRWAANLIQRKDDDKYAKKVGKKAFNWARTYYLTASDIERTVRDFAELTAAGKPWPTEAKDLPWGYGGGGIRFGGDLKGKVRRFLLNHQRLAHHNFGKGHISGARFRPVGEPIAEAEKETMAAKAKRRDPNYKRPRHFRCDSAWRALCTHKRMEGKNRAWWGRGRSQAWTAEKREEVTCKQCLSILASKYKLPERKRQLEDA